MKEKTVSFISHENIKIETNLSEIANKMSIEIEKAINEGFDTFLVDPRNDFGTVAYMMISHYKAIHSDIKLVEIKPFLTDMRKYMLRKGSKIFCYLDAKTDFLINISENTEIINFYTN